MLTTETPASQSDPVNSINISSVIGAPRATVAGVLTPSSKLWNRDSRGFGRIAGLDGVRGLAILSVLITHLFPRFPDSGIGAVGNQLITAGAFGVDLFFALSGFLVTGTLIDSKKQPKYFREFYAKRLLRLFPVYYLYLAIVALAVPAVQRVLHSHMPCYKGHWMWFVMYASNLKPNRSTTDPFLGHFWSLAVEEQFYMFWPVIVRFLSRRQLTWLCAALTVTAFLSRMYLSSQGADWNTLYRVTPLRLDALALGALGAIALRNPLLRLGRGRRFARVALVGASLLLINAVSLGKTTSWQGSLIQTWGSLFLGIASSAAIYLAAVEDLVVSRVLCLKVLRRLGRYSYALYVIHILIGFSVEWVKATIEKTSGRSPYWVDLACFFISFGFSYAVAKVSWRYYEFPITRLQRGLKDRCLTSTGAVLTAGSDSRPEANSVSFRSLRSRSPLQGRKSHHAMLTEC
jgi:peptidoglycan/LPS O-acetylase OafA/YrhL